MYSPLPTLSDVLYYTPTDGYNYMTDNRPLYQLDSNTRAIASSLAGVGYGEHASITGGALTPGSAVELLSTGLIKYPDSATAAELAAHVSPIIGLVVGVTNAGLSRCIWGASLLDLDVFGLAGILGSSYTSGMYLVASTTASIPGSIVLQTTYAAATDLVMGVIRNSTYISIGRDAVPLLSSDPTPEFNAVNNYGMTRRRNFDLMQSVAEMPIQFTKKSLYQSGFSSWPNPLSITYNNSTGQIMADTTADPTYGTDSNNWILREVYSQFLDSAGSDTVAYMYTNPSTSATTNYNSSWPAAAYPLNLASGLQNYELQRVPAISGIDFSQTSTIATFKAFNIVKFYQYARVAPGSAVYGKVTATVTIFDPSFNSQIGLGGETSRTIVCDFYTFDTNGRETKKSRIIVSGTAADAMYSDVTIFRNSINLASSF